MALKTEQNIKQSYKLEFLNNVNSISFNEFFNLNALQNNAANSHELTHFVCSAIWHVPALELHFMYIRAVCMWAVVLAAFEQLS